jgi:hypothetical protein
VLNSVLRSLQAGYVKWNGNEDINNDVITMLNRIGIDTSKEFTINNVSYSVDEGVLRKSDGVTSISPFGIPYLNALLTKAYEQNMLYEN